MSEIHTYEIDGKSYQGFFASSGEQNAPCVLIAHAWAGRDDFVNNKAKELSKLGYHAFALDMYGEGKNGSSVEENAALMQPLLDDRDELAKRVLGASEYVQSLEEVNSSEVAIMGYCFGGLVALDLARLKEDLKGAISFHGFLAGPENGNNASIGAKVCLLYTSPSPRD